MARHAYPPLDNLSPRLVEEMRKRVAPDRGNVWKMLMWSPGMAEALIDFNDAVRYKTSLSDSLRELIILRNRSRDVRDRCWSARRESFSDVRLP